VEGLSGSAKRVPPTTPDDSHSWRVTDVQLTQGYWSCVAEKQSIMLPRGDFVGRAEAPANAHSRKAGPRRPGERKHTGRAASVKRGVLIKASKAAGRHLIRRRGPIPR
jgi:hypothetical protein